MTVPQSVQLPRGVQFPTGGNLQTVFYSGTRVNATAAASSTAEAALPSGAVVVELRMTDFIWIRFGDTGMGAAAADANSMLMAGGEKIMPIPLNASGVPYGYFRVLRVGSTDVAVQIEKVTTQDNP